MKKSILWLVFGCTLPCGALGQTEAPKDFDTIKQVLQRNVESTEQALQAVTEAMPEKKYSFVPTKGEFRGVRTFAQMAKHVAVVNFMNAAALQGENPAIEIGEHENGPDSIKTKAQILKFLKDSFADLREATGTLDEQNLMNPTKDP